MPRSPRLMICSPLSSTVCSDFDCVLSKDRDEPWSNKDLDETLSIDVDGLDEPLSIDVDDLEEPWSTDVDDLDESVGGTGPSVFSLATSPTGWTRPALLTLLSACASDVPARPLVTSSDTSIAQWSESLSLICVVPSSVLSKAGTSVSWSVWPWLLFSRSDTSIAEWQGSLSLTCIVLSVWSRVGTSVSCSVWPWQFRSRSFNMGLSGGSDNFSTLIKSSSMALLMLSSLSSIWLLMWLSRSLILIQQYSHLSQLCKRDKDIRTDFLWQFISARISKSERTTGFINGTLTLIGPTKALSRLCVFVCRSSWFSRENEAPQEVHFQGRSFVCKMMWSSSRPLSVHVKSHRLQWRSSWMWVLECLSSSVCSSVVNSQDRQA